jgi:hypothetical protein
VANGRIALLENGRPTVRDIKTGAIVWQGEPESEEFRCLRFDDKGGLTFVTVDSLVRLSPTGRKDEGRLPHTPCEGCCPSISRDGTLVVWREGETKPFVVLARRQGNARTEIARWSSTGVPFLTPDGRSILILDRLAVLRIDVATRRVSPLAQLAPRPHQKDDDQSITPQTFSPNGRWFLISSREADPCQRVFFAIEVESGNVVNLPVSLPESSCNRESTGWMNQPNVVRWVVGD